MIISQSALSQMSSSVCGACVWSAKEDQLVGALTIKELQEKAKLTLVSATSIVEGGAHDVIQKEKAQSVK